MVGQVDFLETIILVSFCTHRSNSGLLVSQCYNEDTVSLPQTVLAPLGQLVVTLVQHHTVDVLLLGQPVE